MSSAKIHGRRGYTRGLNAKTHARVVCCCVINAIDIIRGSSASLTILREIALLQQAYLGTFESTNNKI